ncbi:MAG TPA: phosphoglycerate dehydrogenase [Acidobacteriaceae bacterium]|jgi:D-3-phosphoglycerate dehydrogenase|nr:phosphoglycerate dehydrogenase [Acidobacteriaceae bacterium]
MKIVLAEKVSPATVAVFASEPGWQVVTHDQIKNGLAAELTDADALVVRSAVQVDGALLDAAPRLRVIGRAGVGVDNIDAEAATRRGMVVMNTPGANAVAVAELTLGLMIALARMVPRANATMHDAKWEKKSLQGAELRGKTLGIVGLGRVGLEVARRARSFGMNLIGHDPFVAASIARENGVTLASVEEVLRTADYITLHVGLTPQTEGLINAKSLASMKKGVRIINCARGELIDEAALVEALRSGHVAGAALDVFHKEPLKDSLFFNLDNVILTPHIAGSTAEAQEAVGIQIAEQVKAYLKLGVVQNAVNVASLSHEEYTEIAPYIGMAENLGSLLAQISAGNVESIQIAYNGRLAAMRTELMRNAALCGVLSHSEQVNRINAASIAAERGIRVHEEKKEEVSGGAANVLKLTLHAPGGDMTASATVLHGSSSRLLAMDGIDIEAQLHGTLLYIRNKDVPGVIGRIGTILGEHSINIASFALGRPDPKRGNASGDAMAVVQIEAQSKRAEIAKAVAALQAVDAITRVGLIELK